MASERTNTDVLADARYICANSRDVSINIVAIKNAAGLLWNMMCEKEYSTKAWSKHELHPKTKDEGTIHFIFLMDLLNFSFWSEEDADSRFAISYKDRKWTGYWSLVAALQRAIEEGIPVASPTFWRDDSVYAENVWRHVFRSATNEKIPLLQARVSCIREAGSVLHNVFQSSFMNCIAQSHQSAAKLVNLLATNFACFRDEHSYEGRSVRLLKRAQILVADLWACFDGEGFGQFYDIDHITMFADYRVPQMLHTLGVLSYAAPLEATIRHQKAIEAGSSWELQLRGNSIWAVELIREEIMRDHPDAKVNAILLDFFLYDTMKELEARGHESIPHHRTRSIWY